VPTITTSAGRAEPVRVVVAVRHAAGLRRRNDPARLDIPQLELLLDAPADRLAGDDAAEHAGGFGEILPLVVGQPVDRLEEHRAMREQHRARLRCGVQRPFQASVADIDREKAHDRPLSDGTICRSPGATKGPLRGPGMRAGLAR